MNLPNLLQSAANLRLEGNLQAAYDALVPLTTTAADHPTIMLEMALTLDAMDREGEAIPYYEKALRHELNAEQRCTALLCLGSSLRNVGRIEHAKQILARAIAELPDHIGLRCFYALSQCSAGDKAGAIGTLMQAILQLCPDSVKPFAQGLRRYADEIT
ncbi:tetratricopeptide repeat protein [Paenibacillus sp. BC26]|uniref:tetratricopeptide repeat protein n=1 Tax=Paenibacillus sp. BC26 TaxID=1881032 RepID=UPI0008E5AD0B|nr:tetratricopeptide repeat protein [Paenibacillus sp. BC26]SFT13833.1 Tetratrico peptide repeat-containing protein [Paenibacillus sp. BC26]